MTTSHHRQSGFAGFELIVILVAAIAISSAAYYGYSSFTKHSSQLAFMTKDKTATAPDFSPISGAEFAVNAKSSDSPTPNVARGKSSLAKLIDSSKFQGLRLVDGTTYFGKLSEPTIGTLQLNDAYHLSSSKFGGTTQVSLVRNTPPVVNFETSNIVSWDNEAADSIYSKAIATYERQNGTK